MQILDGRSLAKAIRAELAEAVSEITKNGERPPHLAAVLVGEDPASQFYVRSKVRSCEKVGFESTLIRRSADITQDELMKIVRDLNDDPGIDGFIVQLPLPDRFNCHYRDACYF